MDSSICVAVMTVFPALQHSFINFFWMPGSFSNHPIARALLDAYGEAVEKDQVSHVKELPGYGVTAVYDGQKILVGNYHLLEKYEIPVDEVESTGTVIYIAVDKKYAGYIIISDALKKDARWTLRYLKEKCQGVLVMLTGDTESSAMETAQELDMDYAYTDLLPGDKLEQLEDFLMVQDARERLVCVGDGINDAPVLARADVGIAMGALGSAAAIEAADIVLMKSRLSDVPAAVRMSRAALRNIHENLFWAFFYNVIGIPLAAGIWIPIFGWKLNPMFGAAAMSLSSVCVVSNALRLNLFKLYDGSKDRKRSQKNKKNSEEEKENKTMKKVMKIEGMMCGHCEARVKKCLEAFEQVEEAAVSHEEGTAVVRLNGELADDVLKKAVEDQDYKVLDIQ